MEPLDADAALRTLEEELERGLRLVTSSASVEALDEAERLALGRKSRFSSVQRGLGALSEDERRTVGLRTNEVREAIRAAVAERRRALEEEREASLLRADRLDVSLPGRRPPRGALHPLSIVEEEIVSVFVGMGYRVAEGPEVETDWYNFQALNMPPHHPARSKWDTLYVEWPGRDDLLLRTHTSPVQIRTMEAQQPPVYVVIPGRCFRQEAVDPSHSPVFHQIEGLAVDEGISMADLKGTLEQFAKAMFGPEQRVRFTPSYFPFTEPSAEVGVSCFVCGGGGCRVCGNGWIEILGAGLVHPAVLEAVGYDSERYTGFAFGLGVERVAMLRYGIPDIRLFFEGDQRVLAQFVGAGQ